MASSQPFQHIGIVGAGNMGTMMSFGLSELGINISLWDAKSSNVDEAMSMSKDEKSLKGKITGFHDVHEFANSVKGATVSGKQRRVFLFSITHGNPADSVLGMMKDDLQNGDIILDGGNEHYRNTERRQRELESKGVSWVGMGVSGGYQSARHGPSLSAGGDPEAINVVLPLLQVFSAKDARTGEPCVTNIGPRGAGHYVKTVHNGIENGMLSTVCEAWEILHSGLGLPYDQIGKIFEKWNEKGELRNTYLVQIGSEICQRKKTPEGDKHGEAASKTGGYVLDDVLDKVVQDDDSTEGTLYWTVMEAANRHVSAPTIATGHFLRVASGNRRQRLLVADKLKMPPPKKMEAAKDADAFIETLRKAVYSSFLCSFCQGLELIARASRDEKWDVNLGDCLKIWRAGCIIQEEYISDLLMPAATSGAGIMNIKLIDEVSAALTEHYNSLKLVVLTAVEADCHVPSLSASLEYLKYEGSRILPTQFMEAELDFFGAHNYDRSGVVGEDPGKVAKGAHHYEWRPA
ncbi:6-phosphogluconate dehydrogenase (decarboxylating) [Helicocarpus griseus UAMH5409]|uniref:6-phosphogluconate dehydrogenase, decarboxylating n=1 Tax=Helicocarpus griseus UAMH5409 TaxID=1447875 RepID=A0A2B7WJ79_9EURO|nr:6-phosphogluconate dehydrogenase (decarboxylating) [Helicocarpus griseus UAMH5409]